MKKVKYLVVPLLVCLIMVTGCGKKKEENSVNNSSTTTTTQLVDNNKPTNVINFNKGIGSKKIYFVHRQYDDISFGDGNDNFEHFVNIRVIYDLNRKDENDELIYTYNCEASNEENCVARTYGGVSDFLIHDNGITYIYNYKSGEVIALPKKTEPLTIDFYAYVIMDNDRIVGIGYYDNEVEFPNNVIYYNLKTGKYTENDTNRDFKNIDLKSLTDDSNVIINNYVQVSLLDNTKTDYYGNYVVDVNNNSILYNTRYDEYDSLNEILKFSFNGDTEYCLFTYESNYRLGDTIVCLNSNFESNSLSVR